MPVQKQVAENDNNNDSESEASDDDGDNIVNMVERAQRDRGYLNKDGLVWRSKYINCNFIFGSSAEVERLWSIAKNILEDNSKSMEPYMFEVYIYLKLNRRFWGMEEVIESDRTTWEEFDGGSDSNSDNDSNNDINNNDDEFMDAIENNEVE